jgi:hypothetical protein
MFTQTVLGTLTATVRLGDGTRTVSYQVQVIVHQQDIMAKRGFAAHRTAEPRLINAAILTAHIKLASNVSCKRPRLHPGTVAFFELSA